MKIEILSIGSEIILGNTINTNASYISKKLLENGFASTFYSVCKDEINDIQNCFKIALDRSDLIIITGGLGPTIDDITKKTISDFLNLELVFNKEIYLDIEKRFSTISSIKEQSTVFKDAIILKNTIGTASGFFIKYKNKIFILLPGVVFELKKMFEDALALIKERFLLEKKVFQKFLNIFLVKEIDVDNFLKTLKIPKELEIGIYPEQGIVKVTLTSNDMGIIEKFKTEIEKKYNKNIFYEESIQKAVHNAFINKNFKLCIAESCTGGAISSKLTALSGASKYFLGSFVTYSNDLKKNILKVDENILKSCGAISKEIVIEMVKGVFDITDADFAIAVSGIAGPFGETDIKRIGLVYIAVGRKSGIIDVYKFHFEKDRELVIESASNHALGILYKKVYYNESFNNARV
ncbi:MAG: hypothetical protein A3F40_01520 [Chlamydiae bacterium RIFCSPHIGHO2_12_FULL_27_8]|nr:MAG: hypothetical protein A3F40_01520 [Chlamydiae bacterium RIFCSPHIGHO2_12_FULL_27_8]